MKKLLEVSNKDGVKLHNYLEKTKKIIYGMVWKYLFNFDFAASIHKTQTFSFYIKMLPDLCEQAVIGTVLVPLTTTLV